MQSERESDIERKPRAVLTFWWRARPNNNNNNNNTASAQHTPPIKNYFSSQPHPRDAAQPEYFAPRADNHFESIASINALAFSDRTARARHTTDQRELTQKGTTFISTPSLESGCWICVLQRAT
jgi:hypothetical protein